MNSLNFDFNFKTQKSDFKIVVNNGEIYGGYEGVNSLSLIEAKNSISKDFLIRQLKFIELILSHLVFNKVLKLYFKKGVSPNWKPIIKFMKESNLYKINSESTFKRRSSTISSWIDWILDQIDE